MNNNLSNRILKLKFPDTDLRKAQFFRLPIPINRPITNSYYHSRFASAHPFLLLHIPSIPKSYLTPASLPSPAGSWPTIPSRAIAGPRGWPSTCRSTPPAAHPPPAASLPHSGDLPYPPLRTSTAQVYVYLIIAKYVIKYGFVRLISY